MDARVGMDVEQPRWVRRWFRSLPPGDGLLAAFQSSMLTCPRSVMFLLLLVARSKLVPDFALTIHCIHLLVTYFYSRSFPKNTLWWTLQLASTALMTLLGMWSCQWRELQPISFGGKGNSTTRDSRQPGSGQAGHLGHQDTGGGMLSSLFGRARGQRADQYELVGIKDEEGGSFR